MNDQLQLSTYSDEELAELNPAELIDLVVEDEDRVPRNVIDECAKRGDAMTEYLGKLHRDDYLWSPETVDDLWWLRLHASMILGLIPTEPAGLLLLELMRRMSQEEDHDLQDWLAGYWAALFQNKPDTVQPALRALCKDKNLGWYIRATAIEAAIGTAAKKGEPSLEPALAWLADIVTDENEDWEVRLMAGNTLLDYPRPEYRSLLEIMADKQTAFGCHFSRNDIHQAYSDTTKNTERFSNPWQFYEPEAITKRQLRWREEDAKKDLHHLREDADYPSAPYSSYHLQETYVRPEPKTGRNDPCPCGSGKKYKKCCLVTDNE